MCGVRVDGRLSKAAWRAAARPSLSWHSSGLMRLLARRPLGTAVRRARRD
ncbi:hypothetical protein C7S16_5954 [Burkholderia thailandensis]|uniref:Uncharacterized protein n=1 Tax=Burkholderia thailandensis TaxID=57975 RepID=A0AAW9CPT2_BURTH|nr:hypothetical protein [Burkholderia thailandensis]MDW9251143.1 hypothetical protein [Burkholderia thailandensis]